MCGDTYNNYKSYRQMKVCEKCDNGFILVHTADDGLEYACCEKCDYEYPIKQAQIGQTTMRSEQEIKERLERMNKESLTTEVDSPETANYLLGVIKGLEWALGGSE